MSIKKNKILDKILLADKNCYVIFYDPLCYYSRQALELLNNNNLNYKGYNINNINGSMEKILKLFISNKSILKFNVNHNTKPIIFINGKFVGGFSELSDFIKKNN